MLYIVLDGAADQLNNEKTPLELANKPALDSLAPHSKMGLMYTIGKGIAPESDEAVISILGYEPSKYYTGRGPIEALGVGIKIKDEYEVAFRANFATINSSTLRIIDRRCKRSLSSDEAQELAKALDGMRLEKYNGYVNVKATVGHRAIVVIGSKNYKLSAMVENTDPAYVRKGLISIAVPKFEMKIKKCIPLDNTIEASRTAELANIFTEKSISILDKHPINNERRQKKMLAANVLLLRDAGNKSPKMPPIREKFGYSFGAITEMPVETGIASALNMDSVKIKYKEKKDERYYNEIIDSTLRLLERNNIVYVHLKGPDEPGHDGDLKRKVKAIENIDKNILDPLLNKLEKNINILVTSDHATPWKLRAHSDDPVEVMFYAPSLKGDGFKSLSERNCKEGSLGLIDHGWLLLPKIFSLVK